MVIRGESGAVIQTGNVRMRTRTYAPSEPKPKKNSLQSVFIEQNGTPASQPLPADPAKMYEDKIDEEKLIVR